jgi:hypothetical protein
MGCSFQPTARCGKRTEERRRESHADDTNGSPRRAAKAKEKPAGVNRRPISTLYKYL